ncbi:MAG: TolC family protein, partial [Thermoanaerobaculia bacterium]|nr:TolC family protein [Thermoanaerobaculia bacterium]
TLDVSERLWDGGSDRYLRQQRELERDLALAQTDVDVFPLRETVTDLYFKVLLLQENEGILNASLEYLQNRLRQAEAAVAGGAALRTTADQIR